MPRHTLTKAESVAPICENSGISNADCKIALDKLIKLSLQAIKNDYKLLLSGFGSFECYHKKARKGRSPQTSDIMILDERNFVVFRLSQKFRDQLNAKKKVD